MSESGLSGFESGSWFGLLAPRGTPASIVAQLNEATNQIVARADFRERLVQIGSEPAGGTPAQLGQHIDREIATWAKVVRANKHSTGLGVTMKVSRPEHLRKPGHSVSVSRAEMEKRVARFESLASDPHAFPDLKGQQGQRRVFYVISPGGKGGPAPITSPHNFHISISELAKGVRPTAHSHPYNEVFMPLDTRFRVFWGETLEDSMELGPFDMLSVPAGVFRTFENLEDKSGHMLAIFDHGGDPHTGIVVPPEVYEKFYKGWVPGMAPTG